MAKGKMKFQVKPTKKVEVPKSDKKPTANVELTAQVQSKPIVSPGISQNAVIRYKIAKN